MCPVHFRWLHLTTRTRTRSPIKTLQNSHPSHVLFINHHSCTKLWTSRSSLSIFMFWFSFFCLLVFFCLFFRFRFCFLFFVFTTIPEYMSCPRPMFLRKNARVHGISKQYNSLFETSSLFREGCEEEWELLTSCSRLLTSSSSTTLRLDTGCNEGQKTIRIAAQRDPPTVKCKLTRFRILLRRRGDQNACMSTESARYRNAVRITFVGVYSISVSSERMTHTHYLNGPSGFGEGTTRLFRAPAKQQHLRDKHLMNSSIRVTAKYGVSWLRIDVYEDEDELWEPPWMRHCCSVSSERTAHSQFNLRTRETATPSNSSEQPILPTLYTLLVL